MTAETSRSAPAQSTKHAAADVADRSAGRYDVRLFVLTLAASVLVLAALRHLAGTVTV